MRIAKALRQFATVHDLPQAGQAAAAYIVRHDIDPPHVADPLEEECRQVLDRVSFLRVRALDEARRASKQEFRELLTKSIAHVSTQLRQYAAKLENVSFLFSPVETISQDYVVKSGRMSYQGVTIHDSWTEDCRVGLDVLRVKFEGKIREHASSTSLFCGASVDERRN